MFQDLREEGVEASRIKMGRQTLLKKVSLYQSLSAFHIIGWMYLLSYLPIYTGPYNENFTLSRYVTNWYTPLLVWLITLLYEIMALILEARKCKEIKREFKVFDIEKEQTILGQICSSVTRVLVQCFGLWLFYLGFGVGNYCVIITS